MAKLKTFEKKEPTQVEAISFISWSDAIAIHEALPEIRAFYVTAGAEHPARNKAEMDRSTGNVLGTSSQFLVITNHLGEDIRVDPGSYILREVETGVIRVLAKDDFFKNYREVVNGLAEV